MIGRRRASSVVQVVIASVIDSALRLLRAPVVDLFSASFLSSSLPLPLLPSHLFALTS